MPPVKEHILNVDGANTGACHHVQFLNAAISRQRRMVTGEVLVVVVVVVAACC